MPARGRAVRRRMTVGARVARLDWDAASLASLDERRPRGDPAAPHRVRVPRRWRRSGRGATASAATSTWRAIASASGEYRYFAEPLPPLVDALRRETYAHLAPIANRWSAALGGREPFPDDLATFVARCARARPAPPTPLLLRYTAGGYNCLHQDLYGAIAFPLQVTILLSRPGADFTGGEILLVEQRPRAQSRGRAITLAQGQAVIFPNRYRPVAGSRGAYRVTVRHGVSDVRSGERRDPRHHLSRRRVAAASHLRGRRRRLVVELAYRGLGDGDAAAPARSRSRAARRAARRRRKSPGPGDSSPGPPPRSSAQPSGGPG